MTGTEPSEVGELSERVRAAIGGYRMGAALDARDLYPKTATDVEPEPVVVAGEGYVRDGVYHVAETTRRQREREVASRRRSPVGRAAAA